MPDAAQQLFFSYSADGRPGEPTNVAIYSHQLRSSSLGIIAPAEPRQRRSQNHHQA